MDPVSLKATVMIPDEYNRGPALNTVKTYIFVFFQIYMLRYIYLQMVFELGELCDDISNIKACACRQPATTEIVHAWI